MKITVDTEKCSGFATCVLTAPDVFELDDSANVAIVLVASPDQSLRVDVEEAERSCPTAAITVTN